jgi:hypothetical protein
MIPKAEAAPTERAAASRSTAASSISNLSWKKSSGLVASNQQPIAARAKRM